MKKLFFFIGLSFLISCQDLGNLNFVADLPSSLNEVSGTEFDSNSELIWMLNDSGNKPVIYGFSQKGKLLKEVTINAKNKDWEDLTSDENGNLYIGDFGNNVSKRKDLVILKVNKSLLISDNVDIERIAFKYPNQTKFPPKKKKLFFDAESFFYYKNFLYIFTKSRVKNKFGKTSLYRVPATKGNHIAEFINEFDNGKEMESWITSADISSDGKTVALLSQKNVLIFTDFKEDDFLSGNVKKITLKHRSQKEGVCFKNNTTLYITDEKAHGTGGNLYELNLN